ncbi:facilitated trehalose transporter Tret1-like [Athalia rosae]|uniref:facilitated trehalose transporter Tret1-like n=1 Tax=Athalia rosae TaxID=37344 RepID=UPI002033EC81|nr:facilitated trehalose transporter Tret1-like [Athalia rosae]
MGEKKIGISQQTLVSTGGYSTSGKKLPQYIAALAATLGAVAFGTVLGWSNAAGKDGVTLAAEYKIPISTSEFSWIGSITNLGAAAICIPIGLLSDIFGRKPSMLMLVVPFTIGWGLTIWANSVVMFYIGRFLVGVSGGAFCVAAPNYTSEIAETDVRGKLGSYFQLMLTIGILLSYILGSFVNIFTLSLISAIFPLIFFAAFIFMPETPGYYLMKDKEDQAKASLLRLRGPKYDVDQEIRLKKEAIEEKRNNQGSFISILRSKASIKALIIGFGLMLFQQLSGVNAIIFYVGTLFGSGSSIPPEVSTIIVGVIQVTAVFFSTLVVDRLGRKILLIASSVSMAIGTFTLGIYFCLKERMHLDVSAITWLPLVATCLFLLMFNFGFGPLPWMMMGELFSPQIKGVAASSACLFNWVMAFLVTRFYSDLTLSFGVDVTFWIFSVICALACVFVVFVVPETKGKSLEQIQIELGGNRSSSTASTEKA